MSSGNLCYVPLPRGVVGEIIKIHHECEGGIENWSRGSLFGITRLAD